MRLSGLVLERVRVRAVDEQASFPGTRCQLGGGFRPIPRNVHRHARRHADERLNRRAVLELFIDRSRLTGQVEAGEACAAGRERPGWNRHAKAHGGRRQRLDVDVASGELNAKIIEIFVER
jgi:hypothetical protein